MTHDVFISYSSKDKPTADAACHALEQAGLRCWIAPRDIHPGQDWGEAIIEGISGAKVFVLVFSANANTSQQIKREVERAVNRGTPIIPFRIENVAPAASLEYFISTPHWLDAFTPPLEEHLAYLVRSVSGLIDGQRVEPRPPPPPRPKITAKHAGFLGALVLLAGVLAFQSLKPPTFEGHWVSTKVALNTDALNTGLWVVPLQELFVTALTGPTAKFDAWQNDTGLYRIAFSASDKGKVSAEGDTLTFTSDASGKTSQITFDALNQAYMSSFSAMGAQAGDMGLVFNRQGGWQIIWVGTRSQEASQVLPAAVVGEWRNTAIPSPTGPFGGKLKITPDGRYELTYLRNESGRSENEKGHWRHLPSTGMPPDEGAYKFHGRSSVTFTSGVGEVTYRKVGAYKDAQEARS